MLSERESARVPQQESASPEEGREHQKYSKIIGQVSQAMIPLQ